MQTCIFTMCIQLKGEHDAYNKNGWIGALIIAHKIKKCEWKKSAMAYTRTHTHTHNTHTTIENVCINIKWINNIICRKKIVNHKRTDLLNNDWMEKQKITLKKFTSASVFAQTYLFSRNGKMLQKIKRFMNVKTDTFFETNNCERNEKKAHGTRIIIIYPFDCISKKAAVMLLLLLLLLFNFHKHKRAQIQPLWNGFVSESPVKAQ